MKHVNFISIVCVVVIVISLSVASAADEPLVTFYQNVECQDGKS